MEHTKGKWKAHKNRLSTEYIGSDGKRYTDKFIGETVKITDADRIVHCVNNFDALLEACKEFDKGWEHFCNKVNIGKSFLDAKAIRWFNETPIKIKQAIEAAESSNH